MARFQLRRLLGQSRLRGGDTLRGSGTIVVGGTFFLVSPTTLYSQLDEDGAIEERRANRLQRFFPAPVAEENLWLWDDGTITTQQPPLPSMVVKVWYGGHVNEVTADEKALIEAAGFTVDRGGLMAVLRGSRMGWTAFPSEAKLRVARDTAKTSWWRWGVEPYDYCSTPANPSSYGTVNWASVKADIDLCHRYGQRCIVALLGVPAKVNASAVGGNGGFHYYPLDDAGDTVMAAFAVQLAALLDPTIDVIELFGQEGNIPDFNRGNATAARVGQATAKCIAAVRAVSAIPIMLNSTANRGDINNPTDIAGRKCGNLWLADMMAGAPTLLTSAKPTYIGYHPYTTDGGITNYALNAPASSNGWGFAQLAASYQALVTAGMVSPKIWVTEYGQPDDPPPDYTGAYSIKHATDTFAVFAWYKALGWIDPDGVEIAVTLFQNDLGGGFEKYGVWNPDGSPRPLAPTYISRALEVIVPDVVPPPGSPDRIHTFTPPIRYSTSPTDVDPVLKMRNPNGNNLMRHFATQGIAVNVWVLEDGTITEDQPPEPAYSHIQRVYLGGHTYQITQAENDALIAAGYDTDNTHTARFDLSLFDNGEVYGP